MTAIDPASVFVPCIRMNGWKPCDLPLGNITFQVIELIPYQNKVKIIKADPVIALSNELVAGQAPSPVWIIQSRHIEIDPMTYRGMPIVRFRDDYDHEYTYVGISRLFQLNAWAMRWPD